MISFREKLVTNERTDERTDGSEFIGPTSEVGGSNNKKLKVKQVKFDLDPPILNNNK